MTSSALWHWRFGRHSNIPRCCRAFFVAWWNPAGFRIRGSSWMRDSHPLAEYVRCPLCMRRDRFEPLHLCDAACPPPWTRTGSRYS